MSLEEERKRLLHKPSVSTLDSEGFSDHESDPVDQTEIESNLTPPPAPVAKSGLAIFCTEIPPPRLLKDNGYVDVVSTHTLKNVISQPFNQKQTSSLALNSEETLRSGTRSPLERLSSRNKDSMESTRSNLTNSITSTHSVELPSLNSSRDVTLSTYDSLPMSPLIPQPLTMQLEDEPTITAPQNVFAPAPTSYFALALCALLCCTPIGVAAAIKAQQVRRHYDRGYSDRAVLASRKAKRWSITAIVTGSVAWTVLVVLIVVILVLKLLAS